VTTGLVVVASVALALDPLRGPPSASESQTVAMSLEECVRRGDNQSPLVRRSRAETRVTAAREVGASLILPTNPFVSVVAGPRREQVAPGLVAEGVQYTAHLEQTLEVAGQRGARRAVVDKAMAVAAARESLALSETRARVRSAYMDGLITAAQAGAARARESLVQQVYEAVKIRVERGAASQIDLGLAEIETGRVARQRLEADLAVMESKATLATLVGLPIGTNIVLTTPLAGPSVRLPPLSQLLSDAQAHRAELRELAAAGTELDAQLILLRREEIPNLTVIFEAERDLPGQQFIGAGLALPLPLWRRNQGEKALVMAARDRAAEERALLERDVLHQVESAFHRVVSTYEQSKLVETRVAPAADKNVALLTEGWRAGKFDLFRVIQASREAGEARRAQLASVRDFWHAVIALDRATGAI
jgi:cobalt-zinc-cadmium efflux system outer membrane protein